MEYHKTAKLQEGGGVVRIAQPQPPPPYICFKVVTHNAHTAYQETFFNSTFHVSFAGTYPPIQEPGGQRPPKRPERPERAGGLRRWIRPERGGASVRARTRRATRGLQSHRSCRPW